MDCRWNPFLVIPFCNHARSYRGRQHSRLICILQCDANPLLVTTSYIFKSKKKMLTSTFGSRSPRCAFLIVLLYLWFTALFSQSDTFILCGNLWCGTHQESQSQRCPIASVRVVPVAEGAPPRRADTPVTWCSVRACCTDRRGRGWTCSSSRWGRHQRQTGQQVGWTTGIRWGSMVTYWKRERGKMGIFNV